MPKHLAASARWRDHHLFVPMVGALAAVVSLGALAVPDLVTADGAGRVETTTAARLVGQAPAVAGPVPAGEAEEPEHREGPAQTTPELAAPRPEVVAVPADPPPPPVPPAVPSPVDHPDLAAVLDSLVAGGPAGVVGVSISSSDGSPLYAYNADIPLVPASTEKNVVAAAALRRLGPDHRYRTNVIATARVDDDGVLDGALVLVGSGDPALGTPAFGLVAPDRPRTPLEHLADQIVAAGVRRVTGGVLGDASVFADEPMAPGWVPAYVTKGHAGRVAGLTVDRGRRLFTAGASAGTGYVSVPVDKPAQRAAGALRNLLIQRGVEVSGPVGAGGSRLEGRPIAEVHSAPLADLVAHTVQTSDNHMADGIFRSLGAADGDPTWEGAATAARAALADLPLRWDGVSLVDGSGLSRQNRLTPDFLVDLSAAMGGSDLRATWEAAMAVTGERGTLRNRMIGTPAQGRVLAKTGTLSGVRALAGTVMGPDGSRYHFAVIGNDLPDIWGLLALQEQVAVALVDDLGRCPQPEGIPEPARCAA